MNRKRKARNFVLARRGAVMIFVAAGATALSSPAGAIDIVLNFDSAQSTTLASDPGAGGLNGLFQYAKTFYEGVFGDAHTLTINFRYDSLPTGVLGSHTVVNQSGGRETVADIRIDSNTNWFIDTTPAGNTEYGMTEILWRDLSSSSASAWFTTSGGTVPGSFEVGLTGRAVSGGARSNNFDMLSEVLHEVGHSLGMASDNAATVAGTLDGDYDYDPIWIRGTQVAARVFPVGLHDVDIAHLRDGFGSMTRILPIGTRRLPTHADLFAMAAGSSFTQIRVPAEYLYGGPDWNDSTNWPGNRQPDEQANVFVVAIPLVSLSAPESVNSVTFSKTTFKTQNFRLFAAGSVLTADSTVEVDAGGSLDTDFLALRDAKIASTSSTLTLLGGSVSVSKSLDIEGGSQLVSSLNDNHVYVGAALNNQSMIRATGDSTLIFHPTPTTLWNLDGTGGGVVVADGGDIIFLGGNFAGALRGTLQVGAGHFLQIDAPFSSAGLINLFGGPDWPHRARLTGGQITKDDPRGVVNATGFASIDAPMVISSGSTNVGSQATLTLTMPTEISGGRLTILSGGELRFSQQATIRAGADFTGNGKLVNEPGSMLTLADGANVGLELDNLGFLEIGSSPGAANVSRLELLPGSLLHVELGGYLPGIDSDLLNVQGTASLLGTLRISFLEGFVPNIGDVFRIMTYGSASGEFNSILNDTGIEGLSFIAHYEPTILTVTATVPEPGTCALLLGTTFATLHHRRRRITIQNRSA